MLDEIDRNDHYDLVAGAPAPVGGDPERALSFRMLEGDVQRARCPAEGCGFVANHITAAHLVICWPEMDDPNLLTHAQIAKEVGRNPRVIEYQTSMGPACSYYQWIAAGRPVHGIRGGGTEAK